MSLMGAAMIERMNAEGERRQRILERQFTLSDEEAALARALRYLQHARASKRRAGQPLSWRDAEAALHGRIGTLNVLYQRAVDARTPKVAG